MSDSPLIEPPAAALPGAQSVPAHPYEAGESETVPVRRHKAPDLTEGSILGHVIRLAIPSALANLFNFSYGFINMIWLGRLGPAAIAVTSTYQYFFMVFVIFNQIVGLGSMTLIARTFGAKDMDGCRRFIGQTFAFKLVIAIAVMVLGLVFQRWAWVTFGSAPDVVEQGVRYSTIMFWVIPIYFSTFTLNTALRAIGDMRRLMIISAVSTVLNLVIDPFLVFSKVFIGPFPKLGIADPLLTLPGAGLGVAGAAWASFGSICVMFIMGLYYFTSGRTFIRVGWRNFFSWNWSTVWRILRIGTPPAIGENMTSIAQLFIGKAINTFGTVVFAANGINGTLFGLVNVPLSGITQGVVTMVGQNLGAKKPGRAERSVYAALGATTAVLLVGAILLYILAPSLIRVFMPGTTQDAVGTVAWGALILRINVWAFAAMGLASAFLAAFWGSGDTKPPMLIALGSTWLLQLPVVYYGLYVLKLREPYFIWWAGVAAAAAAALAFYLVFRTGRWKRVRV